MMMPKGDSLPCGKALGLIVPIGRFSISYQPRSRRGFFVAVALQQEHSASVGVPSTVGAVVLFR
jgi:hypothetical protein